MRALSSAEELPGEIAEARPPGSYGHADRGPGSVSLRARLLLGSRRDRLKQAATTLTICDEKQMGCSYLRRTAIIRTGFESRLPLHLASISKSYEPGRFGVVVLSPPPRYPARQVIFVSTRTLRWREC
jgi:hypothetical protein